MRRHGMSLTFRVLIIAVILLALGVIVLGGFRGGWSGFEMFTQGNIQSSDINTCESRVKGYCQQDGRGSWAERYPACQDHAAAIAEGNDMINENGDCA